MPDRLVVLDTSVLIKGLTPDEQTALAVQVLMAAIREDARLVAPAFAWAEVGSVLRKKIRAGLLQPHEAQDVWTAFLALPIEYLDTAALRERAWALADQYALPTLYDAAFLACVEIAPADAGAEREFWTADATLVRQFGSEPPAYVRLLGASVADSEA